MDGAVADGAGGKGQGKATKGPPPPPRESKEERAAKLEEIHTACQFDDEAAFRKLLEERKEYATAKTQKGATPLHTSAVNGSIRVTRLLLAESVDANAVNPWKETPLHLASASGHVAVVEALLASGVELNPVDSWRRTPLKVAQESGAAKAVEAVLVAAGAHAEVAGDEPEAPTARDLSEGQREQQQGITAEFMAKVQNKDPGAPVPEPAVKHMFAPSGGGAIRTPSAAQAKAAPAPAARKGLSKMVEYPGDPVAVAKQLEDPTVDPAGKDMFGLTALHKFAAWNKLDLLESVLPHLSEADLNATGGDDGFCALHHAISLGSVGTLERLLKDERVLRDVKDKKGRTPLDLAKSIPGLEKAVEMLS